MRNGSTVGAVVAVTLISACRAGTPAEPEGPSNASTLTLTPVTWNASNVDVGEVTAVAEVGPTFTVFSSTGVTMFTSGAPVASDASITTWSSAGVIPSSDGTTTWILGIGAEGHLHLLRGPSALEDVSDRFGLRDAKVTAVSTTSGDGMTLPFAFLLERGVAVSDAKRVVRYDDGTDHAVAASKGRVAIASDGVVRVLDAHGREADTSLSDASLVVFDAAGGLVAATHHALYGVDGPTPHLLYDAGSRTIHSVVASGANVWLAIDGDVGLYQGPSGGVATTSTSTFAPDAHLFASPSGDVWVVTAGQLLRFSGKTSSDDRAKWTSTVQPIYASVCSNCHGPTGSGKDSSGIDLSTYSAWAERRAKVRERVATMAGTPRAMPPPSSPFTLTTDQRSAIDDWARPPQ
jgi:hypothetical protein